MTHSLTHLPQVDKIYVMKDGRISESGTYRELLDQKGAFAEVLVQFLSEQMEEHAGKAKHTYKMIWVLPPRVCHSL